MDELKPICILQKFNQSHYALDDFIQYFPPEEETLFRDYFICILIATKYVKNIDRIILGGYKC